MVLSSEADCFRFRADGFGLEASVLASSLPEFVAGASGSQDKYKVNLEPGRACCGSYILACLSYGETCNQSDPYNNGTDSRCVRSEPEPQTRNLPSWQRRK